jgi:prepilin-type N-terminal cleavage/methylation domain-containing protein
VKYRSKTFDALCAKRGTHSQPRDMRYAIRNAGHKGFTLIEAVTAVIILGLMSSGVLVVISRCMASAADSALRMHAFDVARENMEKLLATDSVKETVEYGSSDKYPGVTWETAVETFYEPITSRMWVKAVCSAKYTDTEGEEQTVELTHWLTDVTKQQLLEIMKGKEEGESASQIIGTIEEAAEYAGVDVATIQQWIDNGMLTTEDGSFVAANLDIYKRSNGNPSAEDRSRQVTSAEESAEMTGGKGGTGDETETDTEDWKNEKDPTTGLTYGELDQMDFQEILELIKKRMGKELD